MESIGICKRVEGHLIFEAEGIGGIFQNSNFDPKMPIGILSLVGEQSDTIFIELLVKQLQENSDFYEPIKTNLNSTTSRKAPVAQNDMNSRVTLWPEAFCFKNTIVLLLRVSYSDQDPEYDKTDELEMFLSFVSSTILEVSLKESEPRFRRLQAVLPKRDKKFEEQICKHIVQRKNLNRKGILNRLLPTKPGKSNETWTMPTNTASTISWALGSISPKIFTGGKFNTQLYESNLEEFFKKCIDDCEALFSVETESREPPLDETKNIKWQQQTMKPGTQKPQPKVFRSQSDIGVSSNSNTFLQSTVPIPEETKAVVQEIEPPVPKPRSKIPTSKPQQHYSTEDPNSSESDDPDDTKKDNDDIRPIDNLSQPSVPEKYNSPPQSDPEEDNTSPVDSDEEAMSTRGFVQVAAEVVLEKLQLKPTKQMLTALQLLVTESQIVLERAIGCWDINNTNFRCDNLLQNVVEESSSNLPKLLKLEAKEQKWVLEQAKVQLLESNCDLGEIETILAAFVAKNVEAVDANALRILINLNVLKSKTLKGNLLQNESSKSLLLAICNNIFMKFLHRNKHTDIFLISLEMVRNFCSEEFKRYVEVGIYSKGDIRKIVDALMSRCASSIALVMSWHFQHDLTKSEKVIGNFCKKSCSKQISDFKKQNTNSIVKHHNKLSSIIAKSKTIYDEKIVHEVTMKVSLSKLTKVHDKERNAAIKSLHKRIQREIRGNEPIEIHEKTLTAEIDTAWKLLSSSYKN